MEKTVRELAIELVLELKNKVNEVKELDLKTWRGRFALIVLVVRYVETLAKNNEIAKEDKKDFAIEIIDQLIDIPNIPDFIESPLIRYICGLLIDQVVEAFNRTLGKLWIERLH